MGRLKYALHFLLSYTLFTTQLLAAGLDLPQCKRPERAQKLIDAANAKYNPQIAGFDQEVQSLNSGLPALKQKVEEAKKKNDEAQSNSALSDEQKANFKSQLETAIANQKNLEFQIQNKQTQKSSLLTQRDSELSTIISGKQYDKIEQYLKMAVSMDGMEEGAKGVEIMAVADVGRRLSCQMAGDKLPQSYSLFKDASNTFALNTVDDTRNYVSQLQLDMMEDCKTFEESKNAQTESLNSLVTQKTRLLQAIADKIETIQTLADGYEPALEAARQEMADKEERIRAAKAWVKEAETQVAQAKAKVKAAKQKVAQAEKDLEDALADLEKAKQEKKKAEDKKKMLMIAAAAAAALSMMMDSKAAAARVRAEAIKAAGGMGPLPQAVQAETEAQAAEAEAKTAKMKKMLLMAALALAAFALMQKDKDLKEEEAKVKEAKKALQLAKNELVVAEDELMQKEAELAQANEELALASTHTKLSCAINGSSDIAVSGAEADGDNKNSLEADNSRADKFIAQFISAHQGRQPAEFVEPQTRIQYLEYVTGLSTIGTKILEKAQRKVESDINEIQAIISQQGATTNVPLASDNTTSTCLNSSGQIDLSCNCRTSNSCFNTANQFSSAAARGNTSGGIALGGNVSAAVAAQANLLSALATGDKSAAKIAKDSLKKAANNVRQEVNKRGGNKLASNFKGTRPSSASVKSSLPTLGASGGGINLGSSADLSLTPSLSDYSGSSLGGDYGANSGSVNLGGSTSFDSARAPASGEYDYDSAGKQVQASSALGASDVGVNDHTSGVSLFDILSYRYQKSAYPRLFESN
jgi:hypothetical protein